MTDDQLEARVAEIISYPIQDRLPDHVLNGLCHWLLIRHGVIKPRTQGVKQ